MAFPTESVLSRVATEATAWFPELQPPVVVSVAEVAERSQSTTAVLELRDTQGASKNVFAKAAFPHDELVIADRPRLGLADGFGDKHRWEWNALVQSWQAIGAGQPDIDAVRPLLHDPDSRTLVTTYVEGRSLRALLDAGDREAIAATARAGAWLAAFHRAPGLAALAPRRSTPQQVEEAFRDYGAFLSSSRSALDLAAAGAAASARFDEGQPLGPNHADFAPRNVIVHGDQVTVIDALARWRVPVLEDVAYMLLELETGGRRGLSSERLVELRVAFLDGYGAQEGVALTTAEALVLLDKWAAVMTSRARSPRAVAARTLRRRRLARAADRLLDQLRAST